MAGTRQVKLDPKWEKEATDLRVSLGISPDYRPWSGSLGKQLHGVACERMREVIDVFWFIKCVDYAVQHDLEPDEDSALRGGGRSKQR